MKVISRPIENYMPLGETAGISDYSQHVIKTCEQLVCDTFNADFILHDIHNETTFLFYPQTGSSIYNLDPFDQRSYGHKLK